MIDFSKRKLGTVISSCDEAFAIYLVKKNGSDWFNYCNENNKYAYQNCKSPGKRQNEKANVEDLITLTNTILLKRKQKTQVVIGMKHFES